MRRSHRERDEAELSFKLSTAAADVDAVTDDNNVDGQVSASHNESTSLASLL